MATGWVGERCTTGPTAISACMLFYCMLGISLLQYVHRQSHSAWPDLTVEQLLEQLTPMQQFTLLYPPLGDKGPNRVATVLSKQTLVQQALAHSLGLDKLCSTQRR